MGFTNPIVAGTTLVRQAINSDNYVTGVSGWSINKDGSAEFQSATLRGSMQLGGTAPNAREVIGGTVPTELVTYYAAGSPETLTAPETVAALIEQAFDGQGNYSYRVLLIDSTAPMKLSSLAQGKVISGVVSEYGRTVLNPNIGGGSQTDFLENAVFFESAANTGLDVIVAGLVADKVGRFIVDAGGRLYLGAGGVNNADCFVGRNASQSIIVDQLVANTAAAGAVGIAETKHAFAFATNWANSGGGNTALQYWLAPDGEVRLRGTAHVGGTFTNLIGTLPAGYRPTTTQGIWAWTNQGSGQLVRVDNTGACTAFGSTTINTDWWIDGPITLGI